MFTSEAVTHQVRVRVQSKYDAKRSSPAAQQWFFPYTITIEGSDTVQLLARCWKITDGNNAVHEVRGPGVVGQQPVLHPGESFTYTSGCPLGTPFGMMEGTYQMVTVGGEPFDAQIAAFELGQPYSVH